MKDWDSRWTLGMKGFNKYAQGKLKHIKASSIACPREGRGYKPSPPQQVVSTLVHPATTVDRLLVAHLTGLGKTYSMILILNNFFDDPRAKAVVFPNREVQVNFYQEIMKFPSKWRDFVQREQRKGESVVDTLAMTGKMHLAGKDGYPAAPLRALLYTTAGGSLVRRNESPLFKFRNKHKVSPYDDMIILMDEVHKLHEEQPHKLAERAVSYLRQGLERARNSVIVGFTATPVVNSPMDARRLLDTLRGYKYAAAETDEGFVSFYQKLHKNVFAQPRFKTVNVTLYGDNLDVYNKKEIEGVRDLHPYCNMSRTYRTSVRAGSPYALALKQDPKSTATKLHAIVKSVMKKRVRTLVLVHRESGFRAIKCIWNSLAKEKAIFLMEETEKHQLKGYNEGQGRVVFADAKLYEAGVSFLNVRRLVIADVPLSWASWRQRIGRVLRFCGHDNRKKKVKIDMFVARRPSGIPSEDERNLRKLDDEDTELTEAMQELRAVSVDRTVY